MDSSEAFIRRCSVKKGVLNNLVNFTGKHLCWSLILLKLCATAPVQYSFLVCSLQMPQYKEQKPQPTWPFLAYQEIEKSP